MSEGPASLLDSYTTERLEIARKIASVTTKTTRFVTATAPYERLMRRLLSRVYQKRKAVREILPLMMSGLTQSYGDHSPLSHKTTAPIVPAGCRMPHACIRISGDALPLGDLIYGTRYTLLFLSRRWLPSDAQFHEEWWATWSDRLSTVLRPIFVTREVVIGSLSPPGTGAIELVEDHLGEVIRLFPILDVGMVLCRPDGFVAASAASWHMSVIEAYFADRGLGTNDYALTKSTQVTANVT